MLSVSPELIDQAILIMGRSGIGQDEIEAEVLATAGDKMLARRLIDCIQEAFGLVLVSHVSSELILPTTFSAKTEKGEWLWFKWSVEPVFMAAFEAGKRIYHQGPRDVFQNIALRSAMLNTVNNLLNAGGEIEGAVLSGPACLVFRRRFTRSPKSPFWTNFLRGVYLACGRKYVVIDDSRAHGGIDFAQCDDARLKPRAGGSKEISRW